MKFKNEQEVHDYLKDSKMYIDGKSAQIQEILFKYGFKWNSAKNNVAAFKDYPFLFIDSTTFTCGWNMKMFCTYDKKEIKVEDILSIEIEESIEEAVEKCKQKIMAEQIDCRYINDSENNYTAGKLKGIQVSVKEAFLAGIEWMIKSKK